jgi:hypothetical protein
MDEYRRPVVTEDTYQMGLIGTLMLLTVLALLFFGRECNREDTRNRQLNREAVIKCVQAGGEALICEKAIRP